MFSLFGLIQKYSHVFVFLFLEGICFYLIVNYNSDQKEIFNHSTNQITGSILNQSSRFNDFIRLEKENKRLTSENARLIREIISLTDQIKQSEENQSASVENNFSVYPAKVISQTIHSNRNYLVLDKGLKDSINSSMGIIDDRGVIGITTKVNDRFTKAISILNVDCKISSSVKGEKYFGTISWDGHDMNVLKLSGIPKHANISMGDTIVTNGYSTIFPPNIVIGYIKDYSIDKSNEFYQIKVTPGTSLGNTDKVYVLDNHFSEDILSLSYEE